MELTYFSRKTAPAGNYSIEFIFNDVAKRLVDRMHVQFFHSKFFSNGIFKRMYNIVEAYTKQGDINHVTGDIHYIGLLLNKKRTIHTIHDCIHLKSSKGIKHQILKLFWHTIPIRKSVFVTANSISTKNEILKYAPWCNAEKIVVIPVAISEQFVTTPKNFNTAKPTILQLGTAANKNIENLIVALKEISCKLIIIGVKHLNLIQQLQSAGIDYEYLQGLTNEEILLQYQKADIITLCSTYEGFGMPILEGQATGRVVITSNCFSMPDVGGNGAHYVNPLDMEDMRNGFIKIIEDETYRNQLIQHGYENVKRFNPLTIANMYYDVYKKVYEAQNP